MSSRFIVNGYQVFGNHELFPETKKFMRDVCHAEYDEDGNFGDTDVTDIMGLVRAIALDMYDEMKSWVTDDNSVLISKLFPKRLVKPLFERETGRFPDPRERIDAFPLNFYWELKWFLDDKRIATVYNLVTHLMNKDDVQLNDDGNLQILPGKHVFARFG